MKQVLYFIFFSVILFFSFSGCHKDIAIKGRQAREYFNNQEYSKVIEILEVIKPSRRTVDIDFLLGKSYGALLEFDKANQIFRTIFNKRPSFKDSLIIAYLSLSKIYEKRERNDLAVKSYNSLLNMESEYNIGNGFYTLGHYYFVRNDIVKAKEFLEKGVKNITNPQILEQAKIELMDLYESLEMLRKAMEVSKDDSSNNILYRRGKIAYKLAKEFYLREEFDSSLAYCKDILEIDTPKTLLDDTYYLMGEIYYAKGDYKNAIRNYRKVIRLDKFRNTEIAELSRKKIKILTQIKKGEH